MCKRKEERTLTDITEDTYSNEWTTHLSVKNGVVEMFRDKDGHTFYRLYAVPRYDNAQCSDCGGQCDYSRAGTVSPRKRYDAAFIDDCQGEEAHQSEPDNRRYSAHACRR